MRTRDATTRSAGCRRSRRATPCRRCDLTPWSTRPPPARYTEASLVKELEERGIGRPSTYASIIGTILDRGYVFKQGTALVPSFLAFAVVRLLEQHFGQLVDYEFTARWRTRSTRSPAAKPSGCRGCTASTSARPDRDGPGLKALVSDIGDIDARDVSSFPLAGTNIVVRVGRYGPYLERDGQRANVPADMAPDELTPEQGRGTLNHPNGDVVLGTDPATGHVVVAKAGRFGPYVTEQLPEDSEGQAKDGLAAQVHDAGHGDARRSAQAAQPARGCSASLTASRSRSQNGRYGPYVKHGAESRSLQTEEQMFTVTLAEAKDLLAQPKPRGRGARGAAPPLRELGADPATGKPMLVKDGRFGPYVTDGETNASLRKSDEVATVTPQRAAELLAERRVAAPSPRRPPARPLPRQLRPRRRPPRRRHRPHARSPKRQESKITIKQS